MPKTRGRIIRILDRRTVIINLGSADGVLSDSTFSILAGPEKVVDPETKEELGEVLVVKAKVRASQVFESFTIASSKWTEVRSSYIGRLVGGTGAERVEVDQGELRVVQKDLQPWKAWSEEPVTVGDDGAHCRNIAGGIGPRRRGQPAAEVRRGSATGRG